VRQRRQTRRTCDVRGVALDGFSVSHKKHTRTCMGGLTRLLTVLPRWVGGLFAPAAKALSLFLRWAGGAGSLFLDGRATPRGRLLRRENVAQTSFAPATSATTLSLRKTA